MAKVYLGIGSNLGDREAHIRKALFMLEQREIVVSRLSSMYETEPWGVTDQPLFINAASLVETALAPRDLLMALKDIEKRMGRLFTNTHWGPRVIDLDILYYEERVINEPDLKIPHPHLAQRTFVLDPLFEIAPEAVDPQTSKTVSVMRNELICAQREQRG